MILEFLQRNPDTIQRFVNSIVMEEDHECWSWRGSHTADGYPRFWIGRKAAICEMRAHRVAWVLNRVEDLDPELDVHHECRNAWCVNPRHLIAVTDEEHHAIHAAEDLGLEIEVF
jgi:hypothetical protein